MHTYNITEGNVRYYMLLKDSKGNFCLKTIELAADPERQWQAGSRVFWPIGDEMVEALVLEVEGGQLHL